MHIKQLGINITDETRRRVILHATIAETILGTGQDAMFLGSRDGHIQ